MSVAIHALVASPGRIRIWVGVFDHQGSASLRWEVNGSWADPEEPPVRVLSTIPHLAPELVTQTGVYEFLAPASPQREIKVQAFATSQGIRCDSSNILQTCPLPGAVPSGCNEWFNVLLVSCFAEHNDRLGLAGIAVNKLRQCPDRPDLILLAGDQVYLDNPVWELRSRDPRELSWTLHAKYRANWELKKGLGYAHILRMAPVASIPDDHEYWNNYPQRNLLPGSWAADAKEWRHIARALYDGFQLSTPGAYTYSFDVPPLSFLMLDSRTSRCAESMTTMSKADEEAFDLWAAHVVKERMVPVIVTGPSLFQEPKQWVKKYLDRNFANYRDYPKVMQGLLDLSRQGFPFLALTGDVHYGRVTKLTDRRAQTGSSPVWQTSYEVIASPSSLVDPPFVPNLESLVAGGNLVRQSFKEVSCLPDTFRPAGTLASIKSECLWPPSIGFEAGNHVALLKFRRIANGIELRIRYLMIEELSRSRAYPDVPVKIHVMPTGSEEKNA